MRPGRVAARFAVAGTALVSLVVPAHARPADDAAVHAALTKGDVYVSSAELGSQAPDVQERLQAQVDALARRGYPVKLAIVAPLQGDDPFVYARRLRAELTYPGTLLVTTRTGPVGAAGDREETSLRGAFQAERVDEVASPTQRLVVASDVALPAPPREGKAWRELLLLIGLTLLGGAWAIAWGLRREQRRARIQASEARSMLKVTLDALAAHADALDARPDLPAEVREAVADARRDHSEGLRAVGNAAVGADLDAGTAALHRGLVHLARAADAAGAPFAPDQPFDGLCAADPAHGPATGVGPLADHEARAPVCRACRDRADAGTPPTRRQVPVAGRPVPFDEAPLPVPPDADAEDEGDAAPVTGSSPAPEPPAPPGP